MGVVFAHPPVPLRLRDRVGLSAYYFFFFAAFGFTAPYFPLHWRSLGFSYLQVGALLAIGQTAGAVAQLPIGALSDRLHTRRPFILAGSALAAACFLAYPGAHSFAQFVALQAISGAGLATSASVASALGADVFSRSLAGRSFAMVRTWGTIGFILVMAAVYTHPALKEAPRLFYQAAGLSILAGACSLLVVRPAQTETHRFDLHGARRLLADGNLRAFSAAYFLGYMALMSYSANLSMYLRSFRPLPAETLLPLAFAISATIELPFLTFAGRAADRFGRVRTLRVAYLVLPLRLAGYAFAPTPEAVLALQTLHGLTFSILAVVPFAFVTDSVPDPFRATGQAILGALGAAACALGPLLSGIVAQQIGIRWLYLFLAAVAVCGTFLLILRVREPDRSCGA